MASFAQWWSGRASRFTLWVAVMTQGMLLMPGTASAVPSFARQTGQACSACHVQSFGPNLTPYGREFKLSGYTTGGETKLPPLSAMIRGSFTHTAKDQPPGQPGEGFDSNDNATLDEASLFYAGRISSNVGAFAQATYADGLEDVLALDNTDIRYADTGNLAGGNAIYGISFNNSPTVQDPWNTTPVWSFPYADSPLAPTPAAETFIGSLGGQVAGATAYLMWNDKLYGEAGLYGSLPRGVQRSLNTFDPEENRLDGAAPYWRLAYVHEWDGQYLSLGHVGMHASVFPQRDSSAGNDSYTDLGIDATYQYIGDNSNIFEVKGLFMHEQQNLDASQALGFAGNSSNTLRSIRLDSTYTWQQTYGLTAGLFRTTGSSDAVLYGGSPDSQGYSVEVDYMPFGKEESYGSPWLNVRLGLNYTGYSRFDGTTANARDNNTLLLNAWLLF